MGRATQDLHSRAFLVQLALSNQLLTNRRIRQLGDAGITVNPRDAAFLGAYLRTVSGNVASYSIIALWANGINIVRAAVERCGNVQVALGVI